MTKIKICGLTSQAEAEAAANLGSDAVGLVFAPSRRQVTVEQARHIVGQLPPFVDGVGVFVNEELDTVNRIIIEAGLTMVQLHGDESPEYCRRITTRVIKAFPVKERFEKDMLPYVDCVRGFLLDTYIPGTPGGTGQAFEWVKALTIKEIGPIILAGGLTCNNVREAISTVKPYAVDVSSGVETEGKKDLEKIRLFIETVRGHDNECVTG